MGTFGKRTRILGERVGHGPLVGNVSYGPDEIAVPQHEGTWASGPNAGVPIRRWTTPGTGPKYLEGPLLEEHPTYLGEIAATTLRTGPQEGMVEAAGDLGDASQRRIPKETGELADSRQVVVTDNGAVIHHSA
jgi:hypothetical protein